MERAEAIDRIQPLMGRDLRVLADELDVTVWKDGKLNKGWVGHTVERYLGIPINSSRSPNFGSWELKAVSLRYLRNGNLVPKETMWVTMIDAVEVAAKEFEDSHLLTKMRKLLVVARVFESQKEEHTLLHSAAEFDLDDFDTYNQVKSDYDLIRNTIRTTGFDTLTGKMGVLIQPRTKGTGHGSTSRAFYARKEFLAHILGIG